MIVIHPLILEFYLYLKVKLIVHKAVAQYYKLCMNILVLNFFLEISGMINGMIGKK